MYKTELNENFDFTKTCRLCLNQTNKLTSIFSISSFKIQYLTIINECTSLKICKKDNLPKNLCLECVECLNKFYQFRKLVVNCELRLNDFLNKCSNSFNKNMQTDNTIKEEIDVNEKPIYSFKSEVVPLLLEEEPEAVENKFQFVDIKVEIDENKFSIKNEETQVLGIESKIEIVEEKLVINENETDLDNYEKIAHDTSSSHLTKDKESTKPFICKICNKGFTFKQNLKAHEHIHTGEKSFICQQCNKAFRTNGLLKSHERIHTGEKPYSCKQCGKSFRQSSTLRIHERTHTGEKCYSCEHCEKSFITLSVLKRHERIHKGEKPYKCKQCEKTFADPSGIKIHARIHTGERPYKCKLCEKSFTNSSNLRAHEIHHKGEKLFKCKLCEKSFNDSSNLRVHKKRHKDGQLRPKSSK